GQPGAGAGRAGRGACWPPYRTHPSVPPDIERLPSALRGEGAVPGFYAEHLRLPRPARRSRTVRCGRGGLSGEQRMTLSVDEVMALAPVIPVLVVENVGDAVPLAQALV